MVYKEKTKFIYFFYHMFIYSLCKKEKGFSKTVADQYRSRSKSNFMESHVYIKKNQLSQ